MWRMRSSVWQPKSRGRACPAIRSPWRSLHKPPSVRRGDGPLPGGRASPPTQDDLHAVSSGNLASIFINDTRLFSGVLELRTSSCRRRAESLAASAGTILYAERRSVFSVAIGVSPVPTRYRVKMAGIWTFVRCGADILLSGLHSDIEGEARCPICGASIRFRIENRMVVDLRPRTAILHVVELPSSPGVIAIACEETQLFDKDRAFANGSVVTWGRRALSRRLKTI